jgi:hypothetical protein
MFSQKKYILKIVASVCLAALAASAAGVAVLFFSKKIEAIVSTIEHKRVLSSTLKQREETIAKITADFARVNGYQEKFDRAMPAVDDMEPLLVGLDGLAKKYALVAEVTLNPPTVLSADENGKATFNIDFSIQIANATVDTLKNYLEDFEALPYYARLESLSLLSPNNGGWDNGSQATISGKIYAKN